jgi:hypothetical protein
MVHRKSLRLLIGGKDEDYAIEQVIFVVFFWMFLMFVFQFLLLVVAKFVAYLLRLASAALTLPDE